MILNKMMFVVHYTGEPSWTKEYEELATIELFFKKYFEEMLVEGKTSRQVDEHLFQIRG